MLCPDDNNKPNIVIELGHCWAEFILRSNTQLSKLEGRWIQPLARPPLGQVGVVELSQSATPLPLLLYVVCSFEVMQLEGGMVASTSIPAL